MKKQSLLIFFLMLLLAISKMEKITLVVVLSGSMEPYFNPGDILVIKEVNPKDIQIGDVISFHPPWSEGEDRNKVLYTHRVIEIVKNSTGVYFITKGDNNDDKDPNPVASENIVGELLFVIPYLGYLTKHNPNRVALLGIYISFILLPGLYILLSTLKELLERPTIARKKERIKIINSRYLRVVSLRRLFVVFMIFMVFLTIAMTPNLSSTYGRVVNHGALPVLLISKDLPGYTYLAPNESCICNYTSTVNVILPVQWLVALSRLPFFPFLLLPILASFLTLISYPLWTSKFPKTEVKKREI